MWSHSLLFWFLVWCYTCLLWVSPLWCHFCIFSLLGYHGASGVSSLIMPIFSFDIFLFLGVTSEFLLGWNFAVFFFLGSHVRFPLGVPLPIGALGSSEWLIGHFNWYGFLIWFYSWFACCSFYGYTS